MGVLACDRFGCDNIMCSRCICRGNFYICNECWNELLEYKEKWLLPLTERQIENNIIMFMHTDSKTYSKTYNIDEVFNRLTNNYE